MAEPNLLGVDMVVYKITVPGVLEPWYTRNPPQLNSQLTDSPASFWSIIDHDYIRCRVVLNPRNVVVDRLFYKADTPVDKLPFQLRVEAGQGQWRPSKWLPSPFPAEAAMDPGEVDW